MGFEVDVEGLDRETVGCGRLTSAAETDIAHVGNGDVESAPCKLNRVSGPTTGEVKVGRIRYNASLTQVSWEAAVTIVDGVFNTQADVPRRDGTYMIKAVTTAGVESVNAAFLNNQTIGILPLNVVELLAQDPTWAGTKTGVHVSSGVLILDAGLLEINA